MYKKSNIEVISAIMLFIIMIILIIFLRSCSINSKREQFNMVPIVSGYCYDYNTNIIYIENISKGRYGTNVTYSIYINENGNPCKYIDGCWIDVKSSTDKKLLFKEDNN